MREQKNSVLRVKPITRKKIDRYRQHKPAWNIQSVVDEAMDALLQRDGLDRRRERESQPA